MADPVILAFITYRNHVPLFRPVIREFRARGYRVVAACLQEHLDKGDVWPENVQQLRELCETRILAPSLIDRIRARLARFRRGRRATLPGRGSLAAALVRQLRPDLAAILSPPKATKLHRRIRETAGDQVPLVALQHLSVVDFKGGAENLAVDGVGVWGRNMERIMRSRGIVAPIRVVGAPHVKRLSPEAAPPRREPGERVRVLYTTQFVWKTEFATAEQMADMKRRAIADLVYACTARPNVDLLIRFHPRDDGAIERRHLEELAHRPPSIRIANQGTLQEQLEQADVVVTLFSHTGFEALLAARWLIVLNYDGIPDKEIDFLRSGAALEALDGEGLVRAIDAAASDREVIARLRGCRERYLDEHVVAAGVDAARRFCDFVETLTSRRPALPPRVLTPPAASADGAPSERSARIVR